MGFFILGVPSSLSSVSSSESVVVRLVASSKRSDVTDDDRWREVEGVADRLLQLLSRRTSRSSVWAVPGITERRMVRDGTAVRGGGVNGARSCGVVEIPSRMVNGGGSGLQASEKETSGRLVVTEVTIGLTVVLVDRAPGS